MKQKYRLMDGNKKGINRYGNSINEFDSLPSIEF
jgi:hypothetical protein